MIKNSLNVSTLSEGFVLDHIEEKKSMSINGVDGFGKVLTISATLA